MRSTELSSTYPNYTGQIEHVETVPEEKADTVRASEVLPKGIADALDHDLYTHQADALDALSEGEDICVSTSTSSGKTLIYGLEIARQYIRDPDSRAVIVHPMKALSRDQRKELEGLFEDLGLSIDVGVYDGDVTSSEKRRVRNECEVVITNFAGLNQYLPHHSGWSEVLGNLETVVVDESHMYTGIQGMHVAWIARRLLRLAESDRYGSSPQVILTSATIGNPKEHSKSLTGRDVTVVEEDGSPRGRRDLVFWNPPTYNDDGFEVRRSTHRESSEVLAHLTHYGRQTLMFAPSRKMTELDTKWARDFLKEQYKDTSTRIEPYNAGYKKDERRELENLLNSEGLDGVVSTTALEVGINIGSMEATVLSGYPGSRVSFWQQVGRSGRGRKDALSVLVGMNSSVDQYIMRNPEYLLEEDVEDAVVDLDNNQVYAEHVLVASKEMPLSGDDREYFGDRLEKVLGMYENRNEVSGTLDTGVRYTGDKRPEAEVDIYATSRERYELVIRGDETETTLPSVDKNRAYRDFHPGAVHLHRGRYYKVENFEEGTNPRIVLEPTSVDYYTEAMRDVDIRDLEEKGTKQVGEYEVSWGMGKVLEYYPTYQKKRISNDNVIGMSETGLTDPVELYTQVVWLSIPQDTETRIDDKYEASDAFIGGVHAMEHSMINMTPLELMVDSKDIGGLSTRFHNYTEGPSMFIYDGVDGGIGFSRAIYDKYTELAERSKELIEGCTCEGTSGCPGCVMDYMCGDNNEPLHTEAAVEILEGIVDTESATHS
jgi:DEAD/DEAH box helicase domain-containing protein